MWCPSASLPNFPRSTSYQVWQPQCHFLDLSSLPDLWQTPSLLPPKRTRLSGCHVCSWEGCGECKCTLLIQHLRVSGTIYSFCEEGQARHTHYVQALHSKGQELPLIHER